MYRALYRNYRPQDFASVVGQNTIIKTLQNSVKNNTFGHAYMFFGPRGVGKTTVSKIFARAINCLNPVDGNACGECEACKHSFEKECVDIIEIDAASNNGVDEIRELKNRISISPAYLKYKVYIIDEVHMLSTGAFNALLKTLEEPPSHAVFILATTDPQKVLDTIISRCQCFSFKRISNDVIVDRLRQVCCTEKIDIDDEVLEEIAISSDGGMRDALSSLDKLRSYSDEHITIDTFAELNGMITKKDLESLANNIFNGNLVEVLSNLNNYNNDGKNLIQIITQLMHYLRNLTINFYINNEKTCFSVNNMLSLVNIINDNLVDIKKSGNPKIYIEMLLIKFVEKLMGNNSFDEKNISREINSEKNSSVDANIFQNEDKNISREINIGKNSSVDVNISQNDDKNISREIISGENKPVDKNIFQENVESDNLDSEEEFDFDKEYSDDEDEFSTSRVNNIDINLNNHVNKEVSENVQDDASSDDHEFIDLDPIILNIDEIMKVRVNNTLATANKNILNEEIEKFKLFEDYTFDQEIGGIVNSFLDAHIRAASEDSIILSFEYDSIVDQIASQINKFMYVYSKITNTEKKIAVITDSQWEEEKAKYIKCLKDGIKYNVIEEPKEVFQERKNDDIIINSAVELFGSDIVEVK